MQIAILVGLSLTAAASLASSAEAQDRLRLVGQFSGIKARCSYEERVRDARFKFNFRLEQAKPGTAGTVYVGATVIGSFVVDSFGRGTIDIDTNEGDKVPDLNVETVLTLKYNGSDYFAKLNPR